MDTAFWHQIWESNQIGFHEDKANPIFVNHFKYLSIDKGSCVFLPLCGKTLDIGWLLSNGFRVVGSELSELAIQQLFADLRVKPVITDNGELRHYKATGLDVFVGDIFALTRDMVKPVNAVFDRGGLVALPENMRVRYARHVVSITDNAPQLLITYEYNQELMSGPPFSIDQEEISCHYKDRFNPSLLASKAVTGKLSKAGAANENVWLLEPLRSKLDVDKK